MISGASLKLNSLVNILKANARLHIEKMSLIIQKYVSSALSIFTAKIHEAIA
jgi:hypothetical protein